DGARRVATLLEVHGQLGGDLVHAIAVDPLAAMTDQAMDLSAPHRRQETVKDFEIQRMTELVACRDGAVREFYEPPRRQALIGTHERFAVLLDPFGWTVESSPDRR